MLDLYKPAIPYITRYIYKTENKLPPQKADGVKGCRQFRDDRQIL